MKWVFWEAACCTWRIDAEAVLCGRTIKYPSRRSQTLKNTSPTNTVPLSETSLRWRVYSKRIAPLSSSYLEERLQGTLSLPCESANPCSRGDQQQGKETGTEKSISALMRTLQVLMSFGLGSWEAPRWCVFANNAKHECWQTAAKMTDQCVWRRASGAGTRVKSV